MQVCSADDGKIAKIGKKEMKKLLLTHPVTNIPPPGMLTVVELTTVSSGKTVDLVIYQYELDLGCHIRSFYTLT